MNIKINGIDIAYEQGETLLDVARRGAIEIPTLCKHDAFPGIAACRVCITEVIKNGKASIVTACNYPLNGETEAHTDSDSVKEARNMIFSLLSALAPDAKQIKELANKFDIEIMELPVKSEGKCMLCGLCVKGCAELGTGAIATVDRGTEKKVSTPYDDMSSDCIGCATCARICPTESIEYTEDELSRTIWKRRFLLKRCERCGVIMGTENEVDHAAKLENAESPTLCDLCRKREMADTMAHAYSR